MSGVGHREDKQFIGSKRAAPISVCIAPVRRSGHEYGSLIIINFIEESPRADAIPPRIGRIALELADVRPEAGVLPQLRVDDSL